MRFIKAFILIAAGFLISIPVFAVDLIISDADSVWSPDLSISSDVVDSSDAVPPNNTWAFVSGADSVLDFELNITDDVVDAGDAPAPNLTEAFVSGADTVWKFDLENQTPFTFADPYLGTSTPVILIPGFGGSWQNPLGVWEIDPILNTYDNLWIALDYAGYEKDKTLFAFPYNWRYSNTYTAQLLKQKIDEVKGICNCDKVNIVAHSMGGLVARAYIESGSYQNDVNKLIFLGTPHKGATKAYLGWEGGDMGPKILEFLSEKLLQKEAVSMGYLTLFDYIRGLPISSVQETLPIYDYLRDKDTGILREYPNNYPKNIFLERLNNPLMLEKLKSIKIVNIVAGAGEDSTIDILRVVEWDSSGWEYGYPENYGWPFGDHGIEYGAGDGMVLARSNFNFGIGKEIFVENTKHGDMVTVMQKEIIKELTGIWPDGELIKQDPVTKSILIRIFSPADFVIIAPNGEKLGKDFITNQLLNETEDAFYSGFGNDVEFAVIPNPLEGDYRVELQGTGNGEYKLSISYIDDDQAIDNDLEGEIVLNQIQKIYFEYQEPTSTVSSSPVNSLERTLTIDDIIKDVEDIYSSGGFIKPNIKNQIIEYLNEIKDSKEVIQIKQLIQLEEKIKKYLDQRFITQNGYNILINDINYLIKNL